MHGIAVLAVKEAALATGFGSALLPSIPPSAVDGFAVGTLLSGACLLLVALPRRGGRKARTAATTAAVAAQHMPEPMASRPASLLEPLPPMSPMARQEPPWLSPLADEMTEKLAGQPYLAKTSEPRGTGKHRLAVSNSERSEPRRTAGRHAAPSGRRSVRTESALGSRELAEA